MFKPMQSERARLWVGIQVIAVHIVVRVNGNYNAHQGDDEGEELEVYGGFLGHVNGG
jgi:hypothetical protein